MAKNTEIKENPHKNHRDRVKEKYLNYGIECFAEHEALEMILFFSIPQKDTNELAHNLIKKFGSLRGVLEATPDELQEVSGIKTHSAVLLGLIRDINRKCILTEVRKGTVFTGLSDVEKYLLNYYSGLTTERVVMMLFDNGMRLIETATISEGSENGAVVDSRVAVQKALCKKASAVILAHNHPAGTLVPSKEDSDLTRNIGMSLSLVNIPLLEHIIVNDVASLPVMRGNLSYIKTSARADLPEEKIASFLNK